MNTDGLTLRGAWAHPPGAVAGPLRPGRVQVLAPARGAAQVGPVRGRLRVSRSHTVVVGDRNRVDVRYRYRVRRIELRRADVDALRRAIEQWRRGLDPAAPLDRAQLARFRAHLRARVGGDGPAARPVRRADVAMPGGGVAIEDCRGVVVGDDNHVRSTEDARLHRTEVRLGRLLARDERIAEEVFDAIRGARSVSAALARAVDAGLGRAATEQRVELLGVAGSVAAGGDGVAGAAACVAGVDNAVESRVEQVYLGSVVSPAVRWIGPPRAVPRPDVDRVRAGVRHDVDDHLLRIRADAYVEPPDVPAIAGIVREAGLEFEEALAGRIEEVAAVSGHTVAEVAAASADVAWEERERFERGVTGIFGI